MLCAQFFACRCSPWSRVLWNLHSFPPPLPGFPDDILHITRKYKTACKRTRSQSGSFAEWQRIHSSCSRQYSRSVQTHLALLVFETSSAHWKDISRWILFILQTLEIYKQAAHSADEKSDYVNILWQKSIFNQLYTLSYVQVYIDLIFNSVTRLGRVLIFCFNKNVVYRLKMTFEGFV